MGAVDRDDSDDIVAVWTSEELICVDCMTDAEIAKYDNEIYKIVLRHEMERQMKKHDSLYFCDWCKKRLGEVSI